MRLYHFSDDPRIEVFVPRSVRVPVNRPAGSEWLNGPLVWAIDADHQIMYLFPRECPRILLWPTDETKGEDRELWWQGSKAKRLAYIEQAWFERLATGTIYRYEMPSVAFEDLNDAGMWVTKGSVRPLRRDTLTDLTAELRARDVELRVVESLTPLEGVWQTTLHASGIRLRNAQGWGKPGWTHSKRGRKVVIEKN